MTSIHPATFAVFSFSVIFEVISVFHCHIVVTFRVNKLTSSDIQHRSTLNVRNSACPYWGSRAVNQAKSYTNQ